MSKKNQKPWLYVNKRRIGVDRANKIAQVIHAIKRYVDEDEFLINFLLGDWRDQPLEVRQLVRKLGLMKLRPKNTTK